MTGLSIYKANTPSDIADEILRNQLINDYQRKLDVAMELYMFEQFTALHYSAHAVDDSNVMSARSLVTRLGDFHRKSYETKDGTAYEAIFREGICTRYQNGFPNHFDSRGIWQARYFVDYVHFAATQLLPIKLGGSIKERSVADKAKNLLVRDEAFIQFIATVGHHLLEQQFHQQALRSVTAKQGVRLLLLLREHESTQAKILHRIKSGSDEGTISLMRHEAKQFQVGIRDALSDLRTHQVGFEAEVLTDFRTDIQTRLLEIQTQVKRLVEHETM